MRKIIHVNQHNIRANLKDDGDRPVITVKTYKSNTYGHSVEIDGPSQVVYPEKSLSCGARVWMETKSTVKVYDRDGELVDVLE
jgi:hypothetical protein